MKGHMNKKILLIFLVLLAGCAHTLRSNEKSLSELGASAAVLDGAYITVHGFLGDNYGAYFLYVDEGMARNEEFSSGVDVVLRRGKRGMVNRPVGVIGRCVAVRGTFHYYRPNDILIGNARSTIGAVVADGIWTVSCPIQ
jgi:hypothetical protein